MLLASVNAIIPKAEILFVRKLREAGIDCEYELEELYTDEEEQELIAKLLGQWCRNGKDIRENKDRFFRRLYTRGFSVSNITEQMRIFEQLSEKDSD